HPDMAADELDAIVGAVVRLDVIQHGPAPHARRRKRLELGIGAQHVAGIADLHEAHASRVISVVGSAVARRIGRAFSLPLASVGSDAAEATIGRARTAEQYDPAPLSVRAVAVDVLIVVAAAENDRLSLGANGIVLVAAVDREPGLPRASEDDDAGFDAKGDVRVGGQTA